MIQTDGMSLATVADLSLSEDVLFYELINRMNNTSFVKGDLRIIRRVNVSSDNPIDVTIDGVVYPYHPTVEVTFEDARPDGVAGPVTMRWQRISLSNLFSKLIEEPPISSLIIPQDVIKKNGVPDHASVLKYIKDKYGVNIAPETSALNSRGANSLGEYYHLDAYQTSMVYSDYIRIYSPFDLSQRIQVNDLNGFEVPADEPWTYEFNEANVGSSRIPDKFGVGPTIRFEIGEDLPPQLNNGYYSMLGMPVLFTDTNGELNNGYTVAFKSMYWINNMCLWFLTENAGDPYIYYTNHEFLENNPARLIGPGTIERDTEVVVCLVVTPTELTLYLNGNEVGTIQTTSYVKPNGTYSFSGYDLAVHGGIGHAKVWPRLLSAEEVKSITMP